MADRIYSASYGHGHAAPTFNYIEDPSLGASGQWRPMRSTDFSSISGGGSSSTGSTTVNVSDVRAAQKISTAALTNFLLAKTGTGILYNIAGYNSNTGSQFVHVFDNTSSGANLVSTFTVDGADNFSIDFGALGIYMNTGILICNSTTAVTQTNGASDIFLTAVYK